MVQPNQVTHTQCGTGYGELVGAPCGDLLGPVVVVAGFAAVDSVTLSAIGASDKDCPDARSRVSRECAACLAGLVVRVRVHDHQRWPAGLRCIQCERFSLVRRNWIDTCRIDVCRRFA